jgi:hypothetical protein
MFYLIRVPKDWNRERNVGENTFFFQNLTTYLN